MNDSFNILIKKLDQFIRKYYKNQIIKGLILTVTILFVFYLTIFVAEYFGRFTIKLRTIIFYTAIVISAGVFIKYILQPFFGLFKIGKIISRKQATYIISKYFPDVKDKLLNTIELHNLTDDNYSKDLIIASVEQRINDLKPVPFVNAINFKTNFKFVKYLAIAVGVGLLIYIINPAVISEGSERIIKHNKEYIKPAPFKFTLLNDSLFVEKGMDYKLLLNVTGEYVPQEVYMSYSSNTFLMKKIDNSNYEYSFKNINNSVDFYFIGNSLNSTKYRLNVLPSPTIINFIVSIDVPKYTGENDRILNNIGDITIPEGTRVNWNFSTRDIEDLDIIFNEKTYSCLNNNENFEFEKRFTETTSYSVNVSNKYVQKKKFVKYVVNVVPDLFPNISVASVQDSLKPFIYYFFASISDDYGFSSLNFQYNVNDKLDTIIEIPFNKNSLSDEFFFSFDFSQPNISNDEKIEYFFEVKDNDRVNGFKSSRSNMFVYKFPSKNEVDSMLDNSSEKMEKLMKESKELAKELKKDVKKLRDKSFEDEMTSWEQSQLVESILDKEKKLDEMLKDLSEENQKKNEMENAMSEQEKEILEKQKMIQELLENLMTDELKELLDKLQKLKDEMKPEDMKDLSEDMDLSLEDLEDQLDKNLEMLKRYDLEEKLNKKVEELDELAKEQDDLSKDADKKDANSEELGEKQKEQKDKFDEIKEEYKELLEDNEELKEPMDLQDFEKQFDEIGENMQEDQESLEKGNNKKASKGQKSSSKKMESLSKAMQSMMDSNGAEQSMEDMDNLRQIIENVIDFSFDQERIMQDLGAIDANNPKMNTLIEDQNKIEDDFVIIRDSLLALASRVAQLGPLVNKELVQIEKKLKKLHSEFDEDRRINIATREQQFVMTSSNNLALLLGETMQQMQQQMSSEMQGNQQCQKPGQGKPSMSQMKGMQESLKNQIQSLIDQMQDGKGGKNGKPKMDPNALNKRLGQMLAQQEVFQKMLKEMGHKSGIKPGTQKLLNEINKMVEENQNEIINKSITPRLLERQKLILSRLLEAEKSENKREIEKKRKSKENQRELISNPEDYFKTKETKGNFSELFDKSNVSLKSYYNKKYRKYLKNLQNNP